MNFGYNAEGLRTKKTFGDRETKYYYANNKLLAERRTLNEAGAGIELPEYLYNGHDLFLLGGEQVDIEYLYGVDRLTGFVTTKMIAGGAIEKKTYYYRKNIQGDITHIFDADGLLKAMYVYRFWDCLHRIWYDFL